MSSDPAVIERYATGLHKKADSRVTRFSLIGLLIGALLGATPVVAPLVSHVHSWVPHRFAYAAVVFGLAAGGYLGFLIGQSRAVALRLQASMAMHQIEIGRALHRVEALRLPLPAAASLPTPAPAPVAAPPAAMAPPAPAPVASLPAPAPAPMPMPMPVATPEPAPMPPMSAPPQLAAVPPVFEWPQPSQDAAGTGS
jgi:hypothetical protein